MLKIQNCVHCNHNRKGGDPCDTYIGNVQAAEVRLEVAELALFMAVRTALIEANDTKTRLRIRERVEVSLLTADFAIELCQHLNPKPFLCLTMASEHGFNG